jgi:hypothetical protein
MGSGSITGVGMGSGSITGIGGITSSNGGTVATSADLGININVVIPIVTTKITAKIPVKTVSDTLLDIFDGKNKRNVLKNPSQRDKKLVLF